MPLYEYQCDACAARFERIQQKFSDPPVTTCPTCGGAVRKLPSSPAIQFKGSGFYITDYARKSEKPDKAKTGDGEKPATDAAAAKDSPKETTKEAGEKPAAKSSEKADKS